MYYWNINCLSVEKSIKKNYELEHYEDQKADDAREIRKGNDEEKNHTASTASKRKIIKKSEINICQSVFLMYEYQ